MYKLETSIDTKIVSLTLFVFYIKLIKSVVSFIKDCCFCAIGCSNVSTNEDVCSVGPSKPEMVSLPTVLGVWIFVSVKNIGILGELGVC